MVTVYRFETWDHFHGEIRPSDRWGTKEAIESESVRGRLISEGVEVDDSVLDPQVDGMTAVGFDPSKPPRRDIR
jgi:hypothetical protein